MSTGRVTDLHEGWRYKHFSGAGADLADAGTFKTCQVRVPFRHILRRAELWSKDQNNSDSDAVHLYYQGDDTDTTAQLTAAVTWGDSTGKSTKTVFPESAFGGETEREPGVYYVQVVSDAGDNMDNPVLGISVSPVPPGPA